MENHDRGAHHRLSSSSNPPESSASIGNSLQQGLNRRPSGSVSGNLDFRDDISRVMRLSLEPLVHPPPPPPQHNNSEDHIMSSSTTGRGGSRNTILSSLLHSASSAAASAAASASVSGVTLTTDDARALLGRAGLTPRPATAAAAPSSHVVLDMTTNTNGASGVTAQGPPVGGPSGSNSSSSVMMMMGDLDEDLEPSDERHESGGRGDIHGPPPPPDVVSQSSSQGSNNDDESLSGSLRALWAENPELRSAFSGFENYIPFFCILLIKVLVDSGLWILICGGLLVTSCHANSVIRQQVSFQNKKNPFALLAVLCNALACLIFLYYMLKDEPFFLCVFFIPFSLKVESLMNLLWIAGVNDFILKFICIILKICIILLPAKIFPYQNRGKYFLFTEVSSQLHRCIAPIQPWFCYLLQSYPELPGKVLAVIFIAVYLVAKTKLIMMKSIQWKNAFTKLMSKTRYGKVPKEEEISGSYCPICHDSFSDPTMLHCKHIFCEKCVTTWFDRERTCPMCRAQVTEDPSWRDGSTSQFIQLF